MCNPALIGLALLAGGTGASYLGQKKGAKAAQRVARKEEDYQNGLRKQSLARAADTIEQSSPQALAHDISRGQQVSDETFTGAESLAQIAGVDPGAVSDARAQVRPMSVRHGMSQGLDAQDTRMAELAHNNVFLGEDGRRSLSTFDRRLRRAGRRGAGLRTAGRVANIAGGAMTGYGLYGLPGAAAGASMDPNLLKNQ